ncbi:MULTISPECIES: RdgB/HAM1 family non-canonical purine NTP pyrophosphatase [Prochlorococcus]|uniref:RdgB/HAM1 family non-canonical purine NTP pyrophosphatase n=1 Tax=Prochlorococcus TaxID=1218 RepID=UPI00056B4215|nr:MULTISPECIES: RdgB/HAM1 family non-canonical purine NTP pyrophosphatase [Prochlorococcus]
MNLKSNTSIPKLVIASGNLGKVKEFRELLSSLPIQVISQPEGFDVDEIGQSFAENARLKAITASRFTGELSLADDSGLSVDALGGVPGIHSARYGKTDSDRINRLLNELAPCKNRDAYFHCALCFASPAEGVLFEVEGRCEGKIVNAPRGEGGFGYDPIFEVKGIGLTFAEMGVARKKSISHRGLAFQQLIPKLRNFFEVSTDNRSSTS